MSFGYLILKSFVISFFERLRKYVTGVADIKVFMKVERRKGKK